MSEAKSETRRRAVADDGLSKDVVFTMLSNQRRRYVIHFLKRADGPVSVRDLSRQVAAWENGVTVPDLTYKQRKRAYTSLHQTHLPKLDESGIVKYDRDRGTVAIGDAVEELDIYLEVVPKDEIPWSVYYLGLAGLSLLTVALVWAGIPPFSLLPGIGVAAAVAVVFVVSAGVQTYHARESRLGGERAEEPTGRVASGLDALGRDGSE